MHAISERLAATFPDTNREVRAEIAALDDDVLGQVAPTDPASYAAVALLLGLAGLAAALGPGLRAARIDPVAALRWE